MGCEGGKPSRKRVPNFALDGVGRLAAVDHDEAIRLASGEGSVAFTDALVEFVRLLFHPIVDRDRANASQHPGASGLDVDVEDERHVRTGGANGEGSEGLDTSRR